MTFRDRTDAGRLLADALVPAPAAPFVVGAIPRGGVTVALPLVERFRAPLTLVYAGKLTAARGRAVARVGALPTAGAAGGGGGGGGGRGRGGGGRPAGRPGAGRVGGGGGGGCVWSRLGGGGGRVAQHQTATTQAHPRMGK